MIAALRGDDLTGALADAVGAVRVDTDAGGCVASLLVDLAPDVLVLSLRAPVDVVRLCRDVATRSPATEMVVVGDAERVGDGYQVLRLGAHAWLSTDDPDAAGRLREMAATGISTLAAPQAGWLAAELDAARSTVDGADHPALLTAPERSVLVGLARGCTTDELADAAGVAPRVVGRLVAASVARLHRRYVPPSDSIALPPANVPDDVRTLAPEPTLSVTTTPEAVAA